MAPFLFTESYTSQESLCLSNCLGSYSIVDRLKAYTVWNLVVSMIEPKRFGVLMIEF